MKYLILTLLFLTACADEVVPQPTGENAPPVVMGVNEPYRPEPIPVKECVVTKTTSIEDCTLYDLMCDDGETDMVLLCPIRYWQKEPPVPRPIMRNHDYR